ncbi:MAG: hypothetical protein FWG35_01640, partial [Spirochaetaceae bacterium]|nr:hypothetical protein [Spirochaetaceae bacterium]
IRNPALRKWFSEIGYSKMPYIFFAGFWHLWMHDYWYPEGGMQKLFDVLTGRLRELGGELLFSRRVSRIEVKGRRAAAVVTENGDVFAARSFVYAGDYKKLVGDLAPDVFRPSFAKKVHEARLTEELFSVYLGLDADAQDIHEKLGAQHVFYFPSYNVIFPDASSPRDVHGSMWILLNHFGRENPGAESAGATTLVLQTYSSRGWENGWNCGAAQPDGGRLPRPPAYTELKEAVAGELIRTAQRILPGLDARILYRDAGTPLSTERFTLNSRGSSGGWCYGDKESFVYRRLGKNLIKTPLENLFAAGHYSLWPGGVISAALSGKIAGNLAAGRRAFAKYGGLSE